MEKTASRMDAKFLEKLAGVNPDRGPGWYYHAELNPDTNVLTKIEEGVAKKPAPESANTFVSARIECEYAPNSATVITHKREYLLDRDGLTVSETITDYWPYATGNNPLRRIETEAVSSGEQPSRHLTYFHPDWTSIIVAQQTEHLDANGQTADVLPLEILHPKGYYRLQEHLQELDSAQRSL
ncbi:MAG: hypothetical protein F4X83_00285 [Chloroflexi bacterium]|nr:hypothetical protein [Chloroflexota bacterium]